MKDLARLDGTPRRPALADWCQHALVTGLVLGGALGLWAAFAVAMFGLTPGEPRPHFSALTSSAVITTSLVGLGMFVIALVTWPLLRWRRGRIAAVSLLGTVAGLFALAHLTSSVLRALSGAYLSLGAIEFLLAGGNHLVVTILSGYALYIATLSVVVATIGVGVALRARRLFGSPARTAPAPRAQALALGLPLSLACLGVVPLKVVRDLDAVSPELAFVSSFEPDPIDVEPLTPSQATATGALEVPRPHVTDGPPQSEGERWLANARKHLPLHTNVLLLTLESIAPTHLGYMGSTRGATPNLDRIASRSVRFRRAWTTATHSNYAQMAILSSLFPRRTTGLDVYKRIDYPRALLHDVFHELGYATGTISSQDETWQGMIKFEQTGTPTFFRSSRDFAGSRVDIGSELVVLDHVTVDVAADWIRRQGERPFSLYVNLQATHFPYKLQPGIPAPYQPTAVTRGQFNYLSYPESDRQAVMNRYDNALHYVDEQIGKLERALDRLGKLDDTIWVITADHGEAFQDHGQVTHGKTLYDSESRVPLLVHWPAKLEPADVDEPVSNLDILPTILDLLDLPPHPAFQGRSFADPAAHAKNASGVFMNIQGLRSAEAVVCWPWKLVVDRSDHSVHLFNLERDPGEIDDRVEPDREIAELLKATLGAQISAQLAYHKRDNPALSERYAPRLLACPALPGPREVATPEPAPSEPVKAGPVEPAGASPPAQPAERSN